MKLSFDGKDIVIEAETDFEKEFLDKYNRFDYASEEDEKGLRVKAIRYTNFGYPELKDCKKKEIGMSHYNGYNNMDCVYREKDKAKIMCNYGRSGVTGPNETVCFNSNIDFNDIVKICPEGKFNSNCSYYWSSYQQSEKKCHYFVEHCAGATGPVYKCPVETKRR
jgi:hypothetical protein